MRIVSSGAAPSEAEFPGFGGPAGEPDVPITQADSVQDAREALLATLDSVEPIVTMSHEDLVVIHAGRVVHLPLFRDA